MEEFRGWFQDFSASFLRQGACLEGPYVCPHRFAQDCLCKKPKTQLYEQAARDCSIELQRSYSVGDSLRDIEAAHRFGGLGCLVLTGESGKEESGRADFTGSTLEQVADWILARSAV